MKKQTLQLIENLKSDIDFNNISVRTSKDTVWEYYFDIIGFYKEKFFELTICKLKNYSENTITTSTVTDCRTEINKKLKQFKIQ